MKIEKTPSAPITSHIGSGKSVSATTIAAAVAKQPRVKQSSSTSFLVGVSTSLCQSRQNKTYSSRTLALSNPTIPAIHMSKPVDALTMYAPRRPNMETDILPPSVSVIKELSASKQYETKSRHNLLNHLLPRGSKASAFAKSPTKPDIAKGSSSRTFSGLGTRVKIPLPRTNSISPPPRALACNI
jgi:hypothetical protein